MTQILIGYARLSKQTEESVSVESQRKDLERQAQHLGLELEMYVDSGLSGYTGVARPEFERALAACSRPEVVAFATYRLDRLARNQLVALQSIAAIEDRLCRFISVSEGIDTSSETGRLMIGILSSIAEQESRNTSARQRRAHETRSRSGRWSGGSRPFGWKVVSRDGGKWLELDPDESALLLDVVDRVLAGETVGSIALEWQAAGVVGSRGGHRAWGSQLGTILRHPRMCGFQTTGKLHKWHYVYDENDQPVLGPEPLIDEATWHKVVKVLERRGFNRSAARTALLSGILRCSDCGSRMSASHAGAQTYVCSTYVHHRQHCPRGNAVSMRGVEALVIERIQKEQGDGIVQRAVSFGGDPHAAERTDLAHRIASLEAELVGDVDPDLATGKFRILGKFTKQLESLPDPEPERTEWIDTGETFQSQWDAGDEAARKELIHDAWPVIFLRKSEKKGGGRVSPSRLLPVLDVFFQGRDELFTDFLAGLKRSGRAAEPLEAERLFVSEPVPESERPS